MDKTLLTIIIIVSGNLIFFIAMYLKDRFKKASLVRKNENETICPKFIKIKDENNYESNVIRIVSSGKIKKKKNKVNKKQKP